MRTKADSPTKICTASGCDRPLRARGLCASHYNQQYQPNRWRRVIVQCDYCGADCEKQADSRRPHRYCSLTCRDMKRMTVTHQAHMPVLHSDPWSIWGSCPLPPQPELDPRPRFFGGRCRHCGEHYIADRLAFENGTGLHCSKQCTKAAGRERRRARKRDAYVADVYRYRVFERDGWRCQICKRAVSRTAAVPHPRAATLDHIVPLALGGTHEPTNCQTACFGCNCRKSHVGVGDQLRLIA